eukprot:1767418-Pleurochrysis_carterae.AAC.1
MSSLIRWHAANTCGTEASPAQTTRTGQVLALGIAVRFKDRKMLGSAHSEACASKRHNYICPILKFETTQESCVGPAHLARVGEAKVADLATVIFINPEREETSRRLANSQTSRNNLKFRLRYDYSGKLQPGPQIDLFEDSDSRPRSPSYRTLCDLMSRWTIGGLRLCRNSSACATCRQSRGEQKRIR